MPIFGRGGAARFEREDRTGYACPGWRCRYGMLASLGEARRAAAPRAVRVSEAECPNTESELAYAPLANWLARAMAYGG
jgi:hypothetical protein